MKPFICIAQALDKSNFREKKSSDNFSHRSKIMKNKNIDFNIRSLQCFVQTTEYAYFILNELIELK